MCFPPTPFFLFLFSAASGLADLAGVSALRSSEAAQKEIQAVTQLLSPLLQTPAESPVKSYTILKHSISINTTYIRIYPARENYVP